MKMPREEWNEIKAGLKTDDQGRSKPTMDACRTYLCGANGLKIESNPQGGYIIKCDAGLLFFDHLETSEGIGTRSIRLFIGKENTARLDFEICEQGKYTLEYNADMRALMDNKGLTYTEAQRYVMSKDGLSAEKIAEIEGLGSSRGAVAYSINSARNKILDKDCFPY